MSNPTERRDMQEENCSGACGVGPDEAKPKSASVRGFESHPPHFLKPPEWGRSCFCESPT
jgi:hypothetical protein